MLKNTRQRGVNFVECLIVLVIISIITSLSLPSYHYLVDSQHRKTTLHSLHHILSFARIESALRNKHVVLCPSVDGESCQRSKNYSTGWIVFINLDQDYPIRRDSDEEIIRRSNSIQYSNFNLKANRYAFTFRPMQKRNTNGTFVICPKENILDDNQNDHKYQSVVLSYTGRPRIELEASLNHIGICS